MTIVNNMSPFKMSDDQTILNMMQVNDGEDHLDISIFGTEPINLNHVKGETGPDK